MWYVGQKVVYIRDNPNPIFYEYPSIIEPAFKEVYTIKD